MARDSFWGPARVDSWATFMQYIFSGSFPYNDIDIANYRANFLYGIEKP